MRSKIEMDRAKVVGFCRRHGVRRLSLFGSVLGDDFRPDSDVDVLVEFEPDRVPGLFGLIAMEDELSGIVGRTVDLRTPFELSPRFRDQALHDAEVQFAADGR